MDQEINILKYGNRKLYLKEESRYTDLREVYRLAKGGALITVVEHDTKRDITRLTLARAIVANLCYTDAE